MCRRRKGLAQHCRPVMLGCEPSVRNDGTMVPVIFAGMWCSERNQIVGSEAREWLATRTDKPKSIYATVARRVHTNLTADESNELSQFWLGHHKDLARLGKQPVMTVSYGATHSGRGR
jgi:DNA-dependent RNA polymerase